MFNFGRSVNKVIIPELSEQAVLQSVKEAGRNYKYIHHKMHQNERDQAIEDIYSGKVQRINMPRGPMPNI